MIMMSIQLTTVGHSRSVELSGVWGGIVKSGGR